MADLLLAGCGVPLLPGGTREQAPSGASEVEGEFDGGSASRSASPAPSRPAAEAPPERPRNALFSPSFDTTEGRIDAGTSFLASWDDGRVLMLSAQHLLGEAGGMSRDYTGAELPAVVRGVTAGGLDGGASITTTRLVTIPDAAPSSVDIKRDLVAFIVDDPAGATVLPLAKEPPRPGERVYLLARLRTESAPGLYPADIRELSPAPVHLEYNFTPGSGVTDESLPGTSGAPLLNARGEVVGVHCAGGASSSDDVIFGAANPVSTVRAALAANLP